MTNVPRREARAATLAALIAISLSIAKFVAYYLTSSAAVFSDALESIVNVAAALFAIYSLSLAHTPADPDHPYGHGKIEFFSGGFEGGMIMLASLAAVGKAIDSLLHPGLHLDNLGVAILVLSGALVFNGGAGLVLIRIGRRAGSLTLEADGKHLMSDAITSSFALIAVVLVRLTRLTWIDPVMAMVVAGYVFGVGIALVRRAVGGLMDRQDHSDTLLLEGILDSHLGPHGKEPRICSYHKLRHRHSGRYHWVDFHIMVPRDWDVDRGHRVASAIEYEIEQALREGNATAHIEPCPDPQCPSCQPVASRSKIADPAMRPSG